MTTQSEERRVTVRSKAFTLVELLVVIGIIAVLISILLPALSKSRRQATLVQCASNLRQYVAMMHVYANEHKGFLPRFDPVAPPVPTDTGVNTIDVTDTWYELFHDTYKIPHEGIFCPEASDYLKATKYNQLTYTLTNYSVWIPRESKIMYPPEVGASPLHPVLGTDPVRGPIRLGERIGQTNPVMSDAVLVWNDQVVDETTFDLKAAPQTAFQGDLSQHFYRGKLDCANLAWVDGHVERRAVGEIKLRYKSDNSWNCW